jgi:hypothetical protein
MSTSPMARRELRIKAITKAIILLGLSDFAQNELTAAVIDSAAEGKTRELESRDEAFNRGVLSFEILRAHKLLLDAIEKQPQSIADAVIELREQAIILRMNNKLDFSSPVLEFFKEARDFVATRFSFRSIGRRMRTDHRPQA